MAGRVGRGRTLVTWDNRVDHGMLEREWGMEEEQLREQMRSVETK